MTSSGDAITRRERKPKPFRCTGCLVEPAGPAPRFSSISLFFLFVLLSLSLSLSPPPSSCFPPPPRRGTTTSARIHEHPRSRGRSREEGNLSATTRVPPPPPPRIYPFLADPSVPSSRSCRTVVVDLKRARVSLGPACDGFSIKSRNIPQPLCSLQWRGEELGQVANGNTLEGGSLRALACCGTMRAAGLNDGQV